MSLLDEVLNSANRNSGKWLPGVEECLKRAKPCGNPVCVDEAMRARGIRASNYHGANHANYIPLKLLRNVMLVIVYVR